MGLGVEASSLGGVDLCEDGEECVFMPKPFAEYSGHKADLLDISWSKNYFLLSASMDKTVRLWHVSRIECLCIFQVTRTLNPDTQCMSCRKGTRVIVLFVFLDMRVSFITAGHEPGQV